MNAVHSNQETANHEKVEPPSRLSLDGQTSLKKHTRRSSRRRPSLKENPTISRDSKDGKKNHKRRSSSTRHKSGAKEKHNEKLGAERRPSAGSHSSHSRSDDGSCNQDEAPKQVSRRHSHPQREEKKPRKQKKRSSYPTGRASSNITTGASFATVIEQHSLLFPTDSKKGCNDSDIDSQEKNSLCKSMAKNMTNKQVTDDPKARKSRRRSSSSSERHHRRRSSSRGEKEVVEASVGANIDSSLSSLDDSNSKKEEHAVQEPKERTDQLRKSSSSSKSNHRIHRMPDYKKEFIGALTPEQVAVPRKPSSISRSIPRSSGIIPRNKARPMPAKAGQLVSMAAPKPFPTEPRLSSGDKGSDTNETKKKDKRQLRPFVKRRSVPLAPVHEEQAQNDDESHQHEIEEDPWIALGGPCRKDVVMDVSKDGDKSNRHKTHRRRFKLPGLRLR